MTEWDQPEVFEITTRQDFLLWLIGLPQNNDRLYARINMALQFFCAKRERRIRLGELQRPVTTLKISRGLSYLLQINKVFTISSLIDQSPADLIRMRGLTARRIVEVEDALAAIHLSLAPA